MLIFCTLFCTSFSMKSPDKAELSKSIAVACRHHPIAAQILHKTSALEQYVIDGGPLLHRIPWTRGENYATIYKRYFSYINERK